MRCFIGFFGITRSLRHTAASIRSGFYEPLRQAGVTTARVGHFNLPQVISNPRSGEMDIVPDRAESTLLDLDLCWVEPQSDTAIAAEFDVARGFPDRFGDGYRSLANLCHQLRSLERVWSMLQLLGVTETDLVLLLRPDLLYLDRLDPAEHLAPLLDGRTDMIVPGWQSWGGLNDRFAFCTAASAKLYATRARAFSDACRAMGGMHAETFLHFTAARHGLRVGHTDLRAVRVRADGRVAANDAAMLAAARAEGRGMLDRSTGPDEHLNSRRPSTLADTIALDRWPGPSRPSGSAGAASPERASREDHTTSGGRPDGLYGGSGANRSSPSDTRSGSDRSSRASRPAPSDNASGPSHDRDMQPSGQAAEAG
ncbi:MAG TPA: hypothetical protein VGC09_23060 [Rhodopila sp.]